MRIKKLSNLRRYEGLHLVFEKDEDRPLHVVDPYKIVSKIEIDVNDGITNIHVKYIEPPQHGYQRQSTQEDVIYVFDPNGRYSHATILSEFAQIRRINPEDTMASELGGEDTSFEPMDKGLERKIKHLINQQLYKVVSPSNS